MFQFTTFALGFLALSAVACAGNVPDTNDTEQPAPVMSSGAISTDSKGMGCMQSSDGSGNMHSVCCDSADETPVNTARCGSKIPAIGCYSSETHSCIFYTLDGDNHALPCPTGLSCEECRSNDDAGLIYACQ